MAAPYFNEEQMAGIQKEFSKLGHRTDTLLLKYAGHKFKNERAREYATNGFSRRIGTVRRSIQNVFNLIPLTMVTVPSRDTLYDAQINLQACVANVYGCIDNLAWIWVYENGLDTIIPRSRVGFRNNNGEVRKSLRAEFRAHLETYDEWMEYLIDFRDALAHRIPLYVPPGGVLKRHTSRYNDLQLRMNAALIALDPYTYERLNEEQSALLIFQPMMTHSITEARGLVPFHAQLIADFATVEELGTKMLGELSAL